jgi:hypothetical protein
MYIIISIYNYIQWVFTGKLNYWLGNVDSYLSVYGILKLRFDPKINNCAFIREVTVYGSSLLAANDAFGNEYCGFGKLLIKKAEQISSMNGYSKLAVILPDIRLREYYRKKCGYTLDNTTFHMLKDISSYQNNIVHIIFVISVIISVIYFIL